MILPTDIERINKLLTGAVNVVITSHHNPDGDAVGSMLGLYHILKSKGIEATMVLPNAFPKFLAWLPGSSSIVNFYYKKEKATRLISNADVLFALDYNGFSRLEGMENTVSQSKAKKVLIDHHPHPDSGFDVLFSDLQVSSTAELVFEVANQLYGPSSIQQDAAVSLFVGIMTDTGSFSYGCSRPLTFQVAAELIARGVDVEEAQGKVYNNFSEKRMRLMGYSISQKMKVFPELKSAYISLSRKELNDFEHSIGDTEGLVNHPLSIKGIVFSALLVENDGFVKVSLRSRGEFPVNEVCKEFFQGGGHRNAAGGKSFRTLEETEAVFDQIFDKYRNKLVGL